MMDKKFNKKKKKNKEFNFSFQIKDVQREEHDVYTYKFTK